MVKLLKKVDGYSTYQNEDLDMVMKIKKIKYKNKTKFDYCNFHNSSIVQELEHNQYLCIDDENRYFILTHDEYKEMQGESVLEKINTQFSVVDAIQKTFGDIYTQDGLAKIVFDKKKQLFGRVEDCGYITNGCSLYEYKGYQLKYEMGTFYSMCFTYLDIEGNICNRDYNIDLNKYTNNKPIGKRELFEKMIGYAPVGEYMKYDNCFFHTLKNSDKHRRGEVPYDICLQIHSGTYIEKQDRDTWRDRFVVNGKKFIKYDKLTATNEKEIIFHIINGVNNVETFGDNTNIELTEFLSNDEIERFSQKPVVVQKKVKRIQETALDVTQYTDIFDYSTKKEYNKICKEYSELKSYVDNISNSIDIENNDEYLQNEIIRILHAECDIPSSSFDNGELAPDNSGFNGLFRLPNNINYTFRVEQGDLVEVTWAHSIYETNIIDLTLIP